MDYNFCSTEEETEEAQRGEAICLRSYMWHVETELPFKPGPVWYCSTGPFLLL